MNGIEQKIQDRLNELRTYPEQDPVAGALRSEIRALMRGVDWENSSLNVAEVEWLSSEPVKHEEDPSGEFTLPAWLSKTITRQTLRMDEELTEEDRDFHEEFLSH